MAIIESEELQIAEDSNHRPSSHLKRLYTHTFQASAAKIFYSEPMHPQKDIALK